MHFISTDSSNNHLVIIVPVILVAMSVITVTVIAVITVPVLLGRKRKKKIFVVQESSKTNDETYQFPSLSSSDSGILSMHSATHTTPGSMIHLDPTLNSQKTVSV